MAAPQGDDEMSFVRTLATLAAGFAAAKGYEAFRKSGGMAGLQDKIKTDPKLSEMSGQIDRAMERMGVPGGTQGVTDMMGKMGDSVARTGEAAMAGLGGLLSAITGAAATGMGSAGAMVDALTGTGAATDIGEKNARLMIRAMIQAAKADGNIDPEERAKIMDHLQGASPEELAYVQEQFDAPLDPLGLAAETSAEMRAQLYAVAAMTIRADTAAERTFLSTLARGLGLDGQTVADLHKTVGVPSGGG